MTHKIEKQNSFPKRVLPIIVFSQFCCTSIWFAGNSVMSDLVSNYQLNHLALGHLTSAVQFGFILGTFLFALLAITDRFSPSKVFFISALIAALFNLGIIYKANTLQSLLVFRFLTGFFLAGIYPVGMKIASDYYKEGLGKSLGFLVGALVVGTAFPHLLNGFNTFISWKLLILVTSILSIIGGVLIWLLVPNGPYQKTIQKLDISIFYKIFKLKEFRNSAFGYFGHMWELYTFWAFTPMLLITYTTTHPNSNFNVPLLTFLIIGFGGLSCILSGFVSQYFGVKKTARMLLLLSCLCCLISPLFFLTNSEFIFIGFLFFWGMVVVADSPLFSTLVAQNVPSQQKGTALTIVNSIGFAITIISLQLLNSLKDNFNNQYLFMLLAIGPIFGLIALSNKEK